MYGIPNNTDWSFLIEKELEQVRIGNYHVSLCFRGDTSIDIGGDSFDHLSTSKDTKTLTELPWKATTLVSLLGAKITRAESEDHKTLVIVFSNEEILKIYDDSDCYESFNVQAPGIDIIV